MLWLQLLVVGLAVRANGQQQAAFVIGDTVVNTVLPGYASFDLDWWYGLDASGPIWGNASILHLNLQDPRLQNYVKATGAATLRIGGSEDILVKYLVGNMTEEECNAPTAFRGSNISLCMNMTRWQDILEFAHHTDLQVVFGVQFFEVNGEYAGTNTADLLNWTANNGYHLYGVEVGEEMAPTGGSFAPLVDGYRQVHGMLQTFWPENTPQVFGPCVGMGDEPPQAHTFWNDFINATVKTNITQVLVMHSYNNDGGDGWKRPGFLAETLDQATAMQTLAAEAKVPLWCGECGPHNGGGKQGVTDRVISSFWYMDALGGLARLGLQQHGRQSLVGGHYGLLQETTHIPNPDMFVLILFNRLMGPRVLDLAVTSSSNVSASLHAYAHCHPSNNGSVSIAFINIDPATSYTVDLSKYGATAEVYLFDGADVTSQVPTLNGQLLDVSGVEVPDLIAKTMSTSSLVLPALSYGFATLDADLGLCS